MAFSAASIDGRQASEGACDIANGMAHADAVVAVAATGAP